MPHLLDPTSFEQYELTPEQMGDAAKWLVDEMEVEVALTGSNLQDAEEVMLYDDGIEIEETLDALGEIVKAGKARAIGISNESSWGVHEHLRLSREKSLPRVVSIQNAYSLLNRSFEIGLAEMAIREQVGLLAYSPLAFGVLSGKYLGGARPANSRLALFERFSRYNNPQAEAAAEAYVNLARESGLDPSQMALAFVNARQFVTSNIIGATTMEQLQTNISSTGVQLEKDVLKEIEAIHARYTIPAP